jgi:hypothetical protein
MTMPAEPHETHVEESDPSGDSTEGLAGDMGISSERKGPVRGQRGEVTHGAEETHPDASGPRAERDAPPEQSADPATGEPHPDNDVPAHPRNPSGNPGHSHG